MRYPKTEWGLKVKLFTQRYGMSLKDLAAAADVKVAVLYQVQIGKTPGYEIVDKVDAFMEQYEAANRPKYLLTPFEGAKPV